MLTGRYYETEEANGDIITAENLWLWYGDTQALKSINIAVPEHSITALIGPSGCGKSTFLKTLDRMNDLIPGVKVERRVLREQGQDFFRQRSTTCAGSGHGVPEAKSLPHEHLRQRGLRPRAPMAFHSKAKLDEIVERLSGTPPSGTR